MSDRTSFETDECENIHIYVTTWFHVIHVWLLLIFSGEWTERCGLPSTWSRRHHGWTGSDAAGASQSETAHWTLSKSVTKDQILLELHSESFTKNLRIYSSDIFIITSIFFHDHLDHICWLDIARDVTVIMTFDLGLITHKSVHWTICEFVYFKLGAWILHWKKLEQSPVPFGLFII